MIWYILKALAMVPLMILLIWGTLKLAQRLQQAGIGPGRAKERKVRLVDSMMLSPGLRVAVIEFHDRQILVSASRHGLTRLAEVESPEGEEA